MHLAIPTMIWGVIIISELVVVPPSRFLLFVDRATNLGQRSDERARVADYYSAKMSSQHGSINYVMFLSSFQVSIYSHLCSLCHTCTQSSTFTSDELFYCCIAMQQQNSSCIDYKGQVYLRYIQNSLYNCCWSLDRNKEWKRSHFLRLQWTS